MTLLKKKPYWITTLIILILSLLKPITVEQTNTAYVYEFGVLFPFLSLRLNDYSSGYQDIFSISFQANSYELNVIALFAACLVCFFIAYILIKIVVAVFGYKKSV